MTWYSIIDALGTLILAITTVLALFLPYYLKKINRPNFSIEFDPHADWNKQLRLKITNNGKSIAHACKMHIEVYNDDKVISSLFIPWDRSSDMTGIPLKYNYTPVTYGTINLYPGEYEFAKLFFYYSDTIKHSFAIYASPYYEGGGRSPPLMSGDAIINKKLYLANSRMYKIDVTAFSEERSIIGLKTLYFKIDDDGKGYCYGTHKEKLNLI